MKRAVLFLLFCMLSSSGFGMVPEANSAQDRVVYPDLSGLETLFDSSVSSASDETGSSDEEAADWAPDKLLVANVPMYEDVKWPGCSSFVEVHSMNEELDGLPGLELTVHIPEECWEDSSACQRLIDYVNWRIGVEERQTGEHVSVRLLCKSRFGDGPEELELVFVSDLLDEQDVTADLPPYSVNIHSHSFQSSLKRFIREIKNVWTASFDVKSGPFIFDSEITDHNDGRVVLRISPDYFSYSNHLSYSHGYEEQVALLRRLSSDIAMCASILHELMCGMENRFEVVLVCNAFEDCFPPQFIQHLLSQIKIVRIDWCGCTPETLSEVIRFLPKNLEKLWVGTGVSNNKQLLSLLREVHLYSLQLQKCPASDIGNHV